MKAVVKERIMDFNPKIGGKERAICESGLEIFQHGEGMAIAEKIIEISEEAYKKNHIYRPWPENEIDQKKESNKSGCHEVAPIAAEDMDTA